MEIGFLLAIMSLIDMVKFDPENKGLVPSILTDEELSLLGQVANITVGLVPGLATVSFYLYSSAIIIFVCEYMTFAGSCLTFVVKLNFCA